MCFATYSFIFCVFYFIPKRGLTLTQIPTFRFDRRYIKFLISSKLRHLLAIELFPVFSMSVAAVWITRNNMKYIHNVHLFKGQCHPGVWHIFGQHYEKYNFNMCFATYSFIFCVFYFIPKRGLTLTQIPTFRFDRRYIKFLISSKFDVVIPLNRLC
jgi:hypothetical protein